MTNQTATVSPGGATLVNSNIAPGSTIYNQDPKNAIWVSSHQDVSPGYGIPVQPLGTATWAGGQLYATVDTGVATPVTLSISSDVTSTDNPVAVGAAVAAELLASGVPSVLIGKKIYSGVPYLPNAAFQVPVDMSQYGSIIVAVTVSAPSNNQTLDFLWVDQASGAFIIDQQVVANGRGAARVVVTMAVKASELLIGFSHYPISPDITIYASNRILPDTVQGNSLPYVATLNQAFTSGVAVDFSPQDYISNGKPAFCRFVATGTNTGKLAYNTLDTNGAAVQLTLLDSTIGITGNDGKDWTGMLLLPPGVGWFSFIPNQTASFVAKVQVIPTL